MHLVSREDILRAIEAIKGMESEWSGTNHWAREGQGYLDTLTRLEKLVEKKKSNSSS